MSEWKDTEIGRIPAKWEMTNLGSICLILTDGAHSSPKEVLSEYKMASVKDMRYDYFDFSQCKTICKEDFEYLVENKCQPQKGDILISKDGANCLDIIFVYNQNEEIVLLSSIAIARLKPEYDPYFYRYFLLSRNAQLLMRSRFVSGSAIPRVVLKDFREVPVPLISLKEQQEISSILINLDSKITLLRQQNETLEELAQTLFKRWFVDFEFPNENGEPYKSSGGKMVDSELGEIPEGWRFLPLSSIANFLNGLACQKYPPKSDLDKMPVLKIKELGNGISENSDWATSEVDKKYIIESGDIIFSWSGTLMLKIWNGEKCVLNQHLFKVTSEIYPDWFIYQWTSIHLNHFIAVAKSKATTMGHIKRTHLDEALCFVPENELIDKYNCAFDSMMENFRNNNKEIQSLTQLRDTLLPKLMSGEIELIKTL